MQLSNLNETSFLMAVRNTRLRLKNPPKSVDEYLTILKKQGLPKTAALLEQHKAEI
jgi:hypothetical protein